MTQTIAPAPAGLTYDEITDAVVTALQTASAIPTETSVPTIAGQQGAQYGPLIRITAEHRLGDATGPTYAKRWDTYTTVADYSLVLRRMVREDRAIYGITAVRGALGGTTRE